MGRESQLTRQLKRYDKELYCGKNSAGQLCIFRNSKVWDTFELDDGVFLRVSRPAPHFICALTHNWQASGRPVDWGYMPIIQRLQEMDLQKRDLVSEIEKQTERALESSERHLKNETEAFFSEKRSVFKKAFSDINTANLSKKEKRRK